MATLPAIETERMRRPWWRRALSQPRSLWLRRALFQLHLWSGLAVGLLATIIGLSGSAIVYRESLDRLLAPKLHQVSSGTMLPVELLVAKTEQAMPGWKAGSLEIGETRDSWVLRMTRPGKAPMPAYVDPVSGRLLGARGESQGIVPWLTSLHVELLSGERGRTVNGCAAVLLFVLSTTGLVLWWPGRRQVRRNLRIRWGSHWPRLQWDLHTIGGLWVGLPLALQSFTGMYLSLGLPVMGVLMMMLGGSQDELGKMLATPHSRVVGGDSAAPLQGMVEEAKRRYPKALRIDLQLPAKPDDSVGLFLQSKEDERSGEFVLMAFDRYSGTVLKDISNRDSSFALKTIFFLDAMHFGLIAGNVSKVLWVVFGLSPGLLFLTGFLMWLRRMQRKFTGKRSAPPSGIVPREPEPRRWTIEA